ncbi:MAG: hypothetical protein CMP91_02575 [Gammaproteobacteria bacterium]|nr:hypothetical protein [Gammaproteobacteria bacterium]|tara:strand:+ start:66 stop:494 length:429 start_codon:yes stop_codon:yes gene_type:complete
MEKVMSKIFIIILIVFVSSSSLADTIVTGECALPGFTVTLDQTLVNWEVSETSTENINEYLLKVPSSIDGASFSSSHIFIHNEDGEVIGQFLDIFSMSVADQTWIQYFVSQELNNRILVRMLYTSDTTCERYIYEIRYPHNN